MKNLEEALKQFIREKRQAALPSRIEAHGPSLEDFYRFLVDEMSENELHKMLDYLKTHPQDQKLVADARQLIEKIGESESQKVPMRLLRRVKHLRKETRFVLCPHCQKPITPFKQPAKRRFFWNTFWVMGAVLSFLFSFAFPRYFLQCLVLALLLGIKWVVEQRAQKTQILVYKALQEGQDTAQEPSKDLHRLSTHL